jgi:hypothetical protein
MIWANLRPEIGAKINNVRGTGEIVLAVWGKWKRISDDNQNEIRKEHQRPQDSSIGVCDFEETGLNGNSLGDFLLFFRSG